MANGMMYSMLTIHRDSESSQCHCNSCTEKGEDDTSGTDEKLRAKIIEHLALQYHLSKGGEHCGQIQQDQTKKKKNKKARLKERLRALEEEVNHLRLGTLLPGDNSNSECSSDDDYDDDDDISEWSDRVYRNADAYNYSKREEQIVVTTSNEQATKNAQQLIKSEEMAKKKAEKKKEKKKRQKEKKKSEKTDEDTRERKSTISSTTSSENVSTNRQVKGKAPVPNDNDNDVSADEKHVSDEDDYVDANAAFVTGAVKQNKKISSLTKVVDQFEKPTVTKKVKCSKPVVNKPLLSSDSLGSRGYQLALNNNLLEAIESLNEAIFLEPGDVRHYINRSYCYLRIGHFSLALEDAQFVMKHTTSNGALAKAACRAGQSYYGLKDYAEAEKSFEESISLDGGNPQVYRELMRVRVAQLTSMGFSEKHALRALQQTSTVSDAVTFLTSGEINTNDIEGDSGSESECEDDIYRSDDDDVPSNTRELTKLTSIRGYITNSPKNKYTQHLVPDTQPLFGNGTSIKLSNFKNIIPNIATNSVISSNSYNQMVQNMSNTTNGLYSNGAMRKVPPSNVNTRALVSNYITQTEKPINDKAIWIGNISDKISDSKIWQEFSKFGQIESVKRHPTKPCMFINYKSNIAASQAITNMNGVEINGIKLPVKTALVPDKSEK